MHAIPGSIAANQVDEIFINARANSVSNVFSAPMTFGDESARDHTLPLKSLEGGVAIRNHVIDRLEQAAQITDKEEQGKLLTFVVIGGGATGVETAGALADAVPHLIAREYPRNDSRVIIIEAGSKLLGHMNAQMAQIALRELKNTGVEVWINSKAKNVNNGEVYTEDGRSISAGTVIWATGIRAGDVVSEMKTDHGKGGASYISRGLPAFATSSRRCWIGLRDTLRC